VASLAVLGNRIFIPQPSGCATCATAFRVFLSRGRTIGANPFPDSVSVEVRQQDGPSEKGSRRRWERMTQFDDALLVTEIRAGSRVAFEALIRRYERVVYRVAAGYAREREDALDLTQRIFLKVIERIKTYRGEGPFGGWLLRIAHREGLNWLRDRRRHRACAELTPENTPASAALQESELLRRERRERLLVELQRLNPRQLLAISLRYQQGMPLREIAAVLECSEGVVKSILFRSLEKLRRGYGIRREGNHVRMPAKSALDREAHCGGNLVV